MVLLIIESIQEQQEEHTQVLQDMSQVCCVLSKQKVKWRLHLRTAIIRYKQSRKGEQKKKLIRDEKQQKQGWSL